MEESNATSNTEDHVEISPDHVYLTQDSDGQIIFVVHPDQQFADNDGNQVMYIETPSDINNDQILDNGSTIQVIPDKGSEVTTGGKPESVQTVVDVQDVKTTEVSTQETCKVNNVEESEDEKKAEEPEGLDVVEPESEVASEVASEEPKSNNEPEISAPSNDTDIKSDEIITGEPSIDDQAETVAQIAIEAPSSVEKCEEEARSDPIQKDSEDDFQSELDATDSNIDSEHVVAAASECDVKEIVKSEEKSTEKDEVEKTEEEIAENKCNDKSKDEDETKMEIKEDVLKTPIIQDSPAKNINPKPMPESGPFILHEDDFEMDDLPGRAALEENISPVKKLNGNNIQFPVKDLTKTNGNIFEKIQNKYEDISPKNVENEVEPKVDEAVGKSDCRRSQRSKRPPEKFSEIEESPQKMAKMDKIRPFGVSSPLKLTENVFRQKEGKSPCKTYIRYQQTPTDYQSSWYRCDSCHYTTTRLENIVRHYKSHRMEKDDETFNSSSDSCALDKVDEEIVEQPSLAPEVEQASSINEMDSDDDELPSFRDICTKNLVIKEDTVVIVNWRKIMWPAVVTKIFKKKKLVDVMVIDSPFKRTWMKLSINRVKILTCYEDIEKINNQNKQKKGWEKFGEALNKAMDFLCMRRIGRVKNAAEYFDPDNKISDILISDDECNSCEDDSMMSRSSSPVKEQEESNSSSLNSTDNQISHPESEAIKISKSKRIEKYKVVIKHILDGKIDDHLLKIFRGEVDSLRNKLFRSMFMSERRYVKRISSFGPIEDESQQEELIYYLIDLMKIKCECEKMEYFDGSSYVFEVFIPEAIIRGIQDIQQLEEEDAKDIFSRGIVYTEEEEKIAKQREFENVHLTEEEKADCEERMQIRLKKYFS